MDFTFNRIEPGKYMAFIDYTDSLYGTTRSRSIVFKTPEAPPNIQIATYKPVLDKRIVTKKQTVTNPEYNITRVYKNQYGRAKITFSGATTNPFKVGQRITVDVTSINGVTDATHQAWFDYIAPANAGVSTIPSTTQVTYYKKGSAITPAAGTAYGTYPATGKIRAYPPTQEIDVIDKVYLKVHIPDNLENSLMWTKTVRDVVFFIFRTASTRSRLKTKPYYYFDTDLTTSNVLVDTSPLVPPTYPGLTNKRIAMEGQMTTGVYEVRYIIARYECPSGDWTNPSGITGYFPMIKANAKITNNNGFPSVASLSDIIVSAAGEIK